MRDFPNLKILRHLVLLFCLSALAACSGAIHAPQGPLTPQAQYKVGNPYKVAGKVYRPRVEPEYDRVGLASWYGPNFHGKRTANGDVFNMNALTAAHTTLPMPSFVRVTNLENGRWLVLKVNDRGPFVGDRLIDVSRRGAQLLGFVKQGVTKVRVQAVTGPDGQLPMLAQNQAQEQPKKRQIVSREFVPPAQKSFSEAMTDKYYPKQAVLDKPAALVEAEKDLYIQVGAFADRSNAEKVVEDIRHLGDILIQAVVVQGQDLFRVRMGPEKSASKVDNLLGRILARGHNTARIIRD